MYLAILKDLRVEKGLSLEELAAIAMAKYYGVSADFFWGLSENRDERSSDISELELDDDAIGILKSDNINNRLLCEIIKHPDFGNISADAFSKVSLLSLKT